MRWTDRIIGLAALVSILIFNVWYIHHVESASVRRQCELINAQVDAYDETPPLTPAGKTVERAYRTLKADNHC